MTLDEAKKIIENAKPIEPIKRSPTVNLCGKEENNTFKDFISKWKKK